MAQIDIKETVITAFDGTLGTVTLESGPSDSDLVVTAISKHIGSDKISIELLDPGTATGVLSVAVVGRKITVTLAVSASAITSTAVLVKGVIDADSDASALVTVALETAGTGIVEAQVEATLDGQQSVSIKIGEGNLTYAEHRNVEFTRDRGALDTVREADEEPLDLTIDSTWEFIETVSGELMSLEDVVKQRGQAAAWVTTADDTCQPYCVDIELWNVPGCSNTEDEILMFEEFYYETIDHDLDAGTFNTTGRCNRREASSNRVLNSLIG